MTTKKKILVLGGTGMAGHMIYHYLDELDQYELFNSVYRSKLTDNSVMCDVTDSESLESLIRNLKPDVVINCVGALVKESKKNPANTVYLNAYLPHLLKHLSDQVGARLIHLSTDCVFSGKKGGYSENDICDADDLYGRSKALGEIHSEPHVTIRTSIIGPELKTGGEGLFHWFMGETGTVNGFTRAMWSGVTTLELARKIKIILEKNLEGLYQVTNGDPVSKYELLQLFQEEFQTKVQQVEPYDGYAVDKSLRVSERYDFGVSSYPEMIRDMKEWMVQHPDLYKQYWPL